MYECEVCGKMFSRKDNLRRHEEIHVAKAQREKAFSCSEPNCEAAYYREQDLKRHLRTTHSEGQEEHRCDECFESFSATWVLTCHMKSVHGRDAQCGHCGQYLTDRDDNVARHRRNACQGLLHISIYH